MIEWRKEPKGRKEWNLRAEKIAKLIPPGTVVLEFGCYTRYLEQLLPESCTYIPSDITSRGKDTLVCDLNKDLPDFPYADIVVFGGTLEFVDNLNRLIRHLSDYPMILCTYVFGGNQTWRYSRDRQGLHAIFEKHGYRLTYNEHIRVPDERLMKWEK